MIFMIEGYNYYVCCILNILCYELKKDWETIWVRFFLLKATLFKLLKYVDSSYN